MNLFKKLKKGTEYLNYGREIVADVSKKYAISKKKEVVTILDIGAGSGMDLINCKQTIECAGKQVRLYGVDNYLPNVEKLTEQGILVSSINIEEETFPYDDKFFDIVIMNQCLEHTKEIFHIFAEISRILMPGGICIVGVPNLASLHNRFLLLFGRQPSAIKIFGPHVRGITKNGFLEFIEKEEYFKCLKIYGSNFYPFPPYVSRLLSKMLPYASVALFFVIKRTKKNGIYSDVLDEQFFETPYKR